MATAASPAVHAHPERLAEPIERALQWARLAADEAQHTCDRRRRNLAPHPGRCIACWLGRADTALTSAARLAR